MSLTHALSPLVSIETADTSLLDEWQWLLPTPMVPVAVTMLGDVVMRDEEGAIHLLDATRARVTLVAADEPAAAVRLASPEGRELLRERDYQRLRKVLPAPATGECYSQEQPAILGGSAEPDNFDVTDVVVHLAILGQIHEQVRDLPDGAVISGVSIK